MEPSGRSLVSLNRAQEVTSAPEQASCTSRIRSMTAVSSSFPSFENDNDAKVREAAVKKITSPSVLKEIAVNDSTDYVRKMAEMRYNSLKK